MSKPLLVIGASYTVEGMDGDVFELRQVVEKDKPWNGISNIQVFLVRVETGRTWVFGPEVLAMTEESKQTILEQLKTRG